MAIPPPRRAVGDSKPIGIGAERRADGLSKTNLLLLAREGVSSTPRAVLRSRWELCGTMDRPSTRGRTEEAGMTEGLELWALVGTKEVL
jgi:hypothetical protein